MGRKVSDEFTVPLCAIHHDEVHRAGSEPGWWQEKRIDPLKEADQLWKERQQTQQNNGDAENLSGHDIKEAIELVESPHRSL